MIFSSIVLLFQSFPSLFKVSTVFICIYLAFGLCSYDHYFELFIKWTVIFILFTIIWGGVGFFIHLKHIFLSFNFA